MIHNCGLSAGPAGGINTLLKNKKMRLTVGDIRGLIKANVFSIDEMEIIEMLLVAINEWPNPNITLEDYEKEVSEFLGGETTKKNIEKTLATIDLTQFAWQGKSLSQLLQVFKFYDDNMTLKDIFGRLAKR
jgi:hypothetical protein